MKARTLYALVVLTFFAGTRFGPVPGWLSWPLAIGAFLLVWHDTRALARDERRAM